ncbi:MAG: ribonuclease R [Bacteroidia bacterium]|nr:ribonuclease R [Bacteroidia bacterium]MDW8134276.1 ribonuclease R [Bacteroidia bacterium]
MRPTTAAIISLFLQKGAKKWRINQLLEQVQPLIDENLLEIELETLLSEGWLVKDKKGRYSLNLLGRTFTGEIQVRHEEAYVVLEPIELRILLGDMRRLQTLPGEKVEVEIYAVYPEEILGRIIKRIAPSQRSFVGIVEQGRNGKLYVSPQQPFIPIDFQLPKGTPMELVGQKVAVRFLSWGLKYPIGEIVEVLGSPRQHQTEIHAIMYEFDLPQGFPREVLEEAAALPKEIPRDEIANRHDFRGIPTFTIDPIDAKDFDDALSFRELDNRIYEVGIHIADVSYYVRPDTGLDREAFLRGTSIYLVDRTIPMLPERLSADLCSLRPHEDRLAFSVVFQLDKSGKVHGTWMGRTLIRSEYRFSYEEAQTVLETGKGPFAYELQMLNTIAQTLHNLRIKEGGIRFETEEIKFQLDEAFRPTKILIKERTDAHKLIEEFMLLANRQVALFLSKHKNLPTVYRVHDIPKPDKLRALKLFLEGFGYTIDLRSSRALTSSLNELIEEIKGKPEAQIIQSVAIRSMPKALYTTNNIGHYGLGFPYYTHFTSPIRRYPDLLVHRTLGALLEGQPPPYTDRNHLEKLCRHSSQREKIAEQAERASTRYKQLEFISQMEGKIMEGIIVGIEPWGLYVELRETLAEGLISIRHLPTDIYERDPYGHVLKARYQKRHYRLGDPVEVRVIGVDFDKRLVDLSLVSHRGEKIS